MRARVAIAAAISITAAAIVGNAPAQSPQAGGASGFAGGAVTGVLGAEWAASNNIPISAIYADYDHDLLENWAEEALGCDPYVPDLTSTNAAQATAIGALGLLPTAWRAAHGFPRTVSSASDIWASSGDVDGDGWDNWSEFCAGTDPRNAENRPRPTLMLHLRAYPGSPGGGRLVVHAYHDAEMNGWPDAVLAKSITGAFPADVELTGDDLIYGHLRQGSNWFFAWIETDGSRIASINGGDWPTWTHGEYAAVADNQALYPTDIGWDRNEVSFLLAKEARGYIRFSMQSAAPAVQALAANGQTHKVSYENSVEILGEIRLKWPRVWIHEGDFQVGKTSGYGHWSAIGDWSSNPLPAIYPVYVDGFAGGSVTNWYTKNLASAAPTLVSPVGNPIVYDARPEFCFTLPEQTTEYQITIKRLPGNNVVFSARLPAPEDRNVTLRYPYSVEDFAPARAYFAPGYGYIWTVKAYNAANTSGSTEASDYFQIAAEGQQLDAGKGRLAARIDYPAGTAYSENNPPEIRLRVFEGPDFGGFPAMGRRLGSPGAIGGQGLEVGKPYYLMAYIDQNTNFVHDISEPWGCLRDAGTGLPSPFYAETGTNLATRVITIVDRP